LLCWLYCPLCVTVGSRAEPKNQVRNRGTFGCNHFSIYLYIFSPLSPKFFYVSLFNSAAKKYFLGVKNAGGGICHPLPPPPIYTCGYKHQLRVLLWRSFDICGNMLVLHTEIVFCFKRLQSNYLVSHSPTLYVLRSACS
jgi:hypothetical protein